MDRIREMKKEYKNIIIPDELKNRTLEGIKKGKTEDMKKNMVKVSKYMGVSLAAAMLTIVILANSSESLAYAMEQIPVIGAITKVVTIRTYEDKTKGFEANIKVPEIQVEDIKGEDSTQIENKQDTNSSLIEGVEEINKSVEEYTNMLIEQYNADMEATGAEGNYGVDADYEIVTDNDEIFSLRINTVITMAGGTNYSKIYHMNKKTGTTFILPDIFKADANYLTAISDNIKSQMKEQMAEDEMITYFYDNEDTYAWNFESIDADENFYFNKDGELVIVFDEYEVAPGYMGIVEFTIPDEAIVDIMK